MPACPQCGEENPERARFCLACGAALEAAEPAREERKRVTVLFADLVGFTSKAERLDPEEVRALQAPYWARVKAEIERYGGTVEKFIGDAVMALFGAPVAHEDDPERAVRAALTIRDRIAQDDGLQVRIAVTTGEALVALGRAAGRGRGHGLGRRREHGLAPAVGRADERDPRGRDDLPRDCARDRVPRGGTGAGEGKGGAGSGLGSRRAALALRRRRRAARRRRADRPLRGARPAHRRARPGPAGARVPARHPRRRPRDRQVAARLRAFTRRGRGSGAHLLAAGTFAPVRRGRHLLGAERDGQGTCRDPRVGRCRGSRREAAGRGRGGDLRRGRRGLGDGAPAAARRACRRGGGRRRPPGRDLRRLAEVLRGARRARPARPGLRGPPVGGRRPARLRRPPGGVGERRPAPLRLHRAARAARAASRLGRREAERDDDLALAALRDARPRS